MLLFAITQDTNCVGSIPEPAGHLGCALAEYAVLWKRLTRMSVPDMEPSKHPADISTIAFIVTSSSISRKCSGIGYQKCSSSHHLKRK